jgi:PPOX class probable F420-dependent enzyme
VDLDDAREVVREQHRAVLATLRGDGTPQMSPVLVALDDDGRVLVSTRETAVKVRNVRRDPRLWLCVLPDGFFGRWVQVEGRAEIVALPDAMEGLVDYYRRVSGEHENWDDYRSAMQRERRVLLRITLNRAGPQRRARGAIRASGGSADNTCGQLGELFDESGAMPITVVRRLALAVYAERRSSVRVARRHRYMPVGPRPSGYRDARG